MTMPFKSLFDSTPGLMPLEVNSQNSWIVWGDIGRFELKRPFYEWGLRDFHQTVGIRSVVRTPIEILDDPALVSDTLYPSGFIFHMSRCGSSVLVRALSQAPSHLVISEPEPLNQLLFMLSGLEIQRQITSRRRVGMLRNLILAFGRKRGLDKTRYYMKFSSWNVLLAETIVGMFSDVPSLFLYRNPEEVMVSIARTPTGFAQSKAMTLGEKMSGCDRRSLNRMTREDYTAAVLENFLGSALRLPSMRFLNYQYVDVEHFPKVADLFDCSRDSESMEKMANEFKYDAKNPQLTIKFVPDSSTKQAAATPGIRKACDRWLSSSYLAMLSSDRNLVH